MLSFKPCEIDLYPTIPTISCPDLLFLISNQNKIPSYLRFLTSQSLVIKISREDKAQFHSAWELTSRLDHKKQHPRLFVAR